MHEYHAVEQIVRQAVAFVREHNAARVTRAVLSVGRDAGFDPESIRLYFEQVSSATPLAGAEVEVRVSDGKQGLRLEAIEVEE